MLLLCLSLAQPVNTQGGLKAARDYKGVVALDLSVASLAITSWGIAQWGWFTQSPVFKREGWFGADTSSGGADKTGHFYMSYVMSDLFLLDFKRHGVKNPEQIT